MIPIKHNRGEGNLQQLRKKRRPARPASPLIVRLGQILQNGWLIATVAGLVAACGIVYAVNVTPVYESNILIQIKRSAPFAGEPQADIPAATEVEILRSRAILARVVEALQLDITIEPKRFPVLGTFLAARYPDLSIPWLVGQGGYAWGADSVRLAVFAVPKELLQHPFTLTVTGPDALTLSDPVLGLRLHARVGERAQLQTKFGPLAMQVAQIRARPGAAFTVSQRAPVQVVEQLQRGLVISEKVKQSNVITVSLQGTRPELLSRILNQIGREYISQQVSLRTVEAKNQLAFYDQQVAESGKRLQQLDVRVNQILSRFGTSDLSEEERLLAQQSAALKAKLEDKEQRKVELSGRFADQHPEIITLSTVIRNLRREFDDVEGKRRIIASAQHDITSANRDKQITSEMNIAVVNARHKLDALMLSNNVNIRWIDRAEVPMQATTLGLTVMIAIACVMGLVAGVGASLLKNVMASPRSGAGVADDGRRMLSADVPGKPATTDFRKHAARS